MSKPKHVSREMQCLHRVNTEAVMLYGWVQGCKDLCKILGVQNVAVDTIIKRFCDTNDIEDFYSMKTQYYIMQKRLIKGGE